VAAKRARKRAVAEIPEAPEKVSELRLVARLLGLALVKGQSQEEQVGTLTAVGFASGEIAALLGTSPGTVRQAAYMWRKKTRALPRRAANSLNVGSPPSAREKAR